MSRQQLALIGQITTAIAVTTAWFYGNLAVLQLYLDVDTAQYYLDVVRENIYHPHHLFYTWSGRRLFELVSHYGYDGGEMLLMQLLNLGLTSLALGFTTFAALRLGHSLLVTLATLAALAFSHGYWFYSHINDTAGAPTAMALITFWSAILLFHNRPDRSARSRSRLYRPLFAAPALLALLHLIAIGYHQTNVLLYPAIAILIVGQIANGRENARRAIWQFALYTTLITAATSAIYLHVGSVRLGLPVAGDERVRIQGIPGGGNFLDWLFLYRHWDESLNWGNPAERKSQLAEALHGSTNALYFQRRNHWPNQWRQMSVERLERQPANQIAILRLLIAIVAIALLALPFTLIGRSLTALAALAWCIPFTVLVWWWEPSHFEFWVQPVTALFTLLLLSAGQIERWPLLRSLPAPLGSALVALPLALLAVLLFTHNYRLKFSPHAHRVLFGYWEDRLAKESFTPLWDRAYHRPPTVVTLNPEHAFAQRLIQVESLLRLLLTDENPAFFAMRARRLEHLLHGLEQLNPEAPELEWLRPMVQELEHGRDHFLWLYAPQSLQEEQEEPVQQQETVPEELNR